MWLDWNWPAAEAALRRAIGLNPHNALAHHELGQLLTRVGRCDDAIPEVERAVLENPVYPNFQSGLAEVYLNCRRYERAIDEFEKALPLARDSDAIYRDIGDAYFFQGKYTTALASYRKARWVPGWAYVPLGDRQRALAQIDTLTRRWAAGTAAPYEPYLLAKLYTSLGDRDQAITWLERLYGARTGLVVYLKVQPHFDPLRGEPRFQALLKKAGLND
jgi:tetratricopeptide (TPR) repeat protein